LQTSGILVNCNYICNMKPNESEINSSYIHVKSDVVPAWVNSLNEFKAKVKASIHSNDNQLSEDIKFSHPINVPDKGRI